jgi:hypothetical protein
MYVKSTMANCFVQEMPRASSEQAAVVASEIGMKYGLHIFFFFEKNTTYSTMKRRWIDDKRGANKGIGIELKKLSQQTGRQQQ